MKRKLLVFLFLSLCLSVPVSAAKVNDSQQRITVQLNDASIRELFAAIKKQADVNFMYSNNLVNQLPYKDYNFKDSSLENILSYCLEDTDLQYEIVNNTIVIKKKSGRNEITGRVVDSEGLPLAGVTIFEKGTSRGTATNINGEFRLATERNTGVKLIASFLGMKQQELAWSGKPLNILMEDEFKQINEVVVTGYQIIDKRSLTSAVTTLKPSEIMRADVMSIDQMLEGQVPDLIFTSNSGEVGVVPRLRIRGTSTLIGNREPLWVIDGIVMQDPINVSAEELNDPDYVNRIGNAIAGINPQDIERIDVLKDAAATALYGTKAANGVIVVTTKRGHEGKPQVSYNMGLTYKLRPRYTDRSIDLMNSKERIQFSRELLSGHYKYDNTINMVGYEGLLNDLYNGKINNAEFGRQVSALETLNTDWFDLLTRDSFSNQHTISLSGGSGTSRYYTSIGFVNNEDVIKDNYNKRYTATLNIDNQINKWLIAAFSIKGNVNDRKYYQDEIAPMDYAYSTARTIPAYAQDGSGDYFYYKKNYSKLLGQNFNILNELENSSYKQDVKTVTADANFQLKFTDYLKASAIFSYGISNSTIEGYWGPETYHASVIRGTDPGVLPSVGSSTEMPMGGELTENHVRNNYYTIRAQVDFNKYLDPEQIHNISASLGYEMSSTKYKEYKNVTRGYFPDRGMSFVDNINLDDYPYYKTWMANNNPVLGNSLTNIMSGYATLSYAYKYLFIVNANARIDGSNQFGDRSNEKLLPIWSVSGLFNAAELDFLQNDWLDYLNFKASYGYQGNMLNSEYPVLCIKKNALDSYYNEYTASVANYPNPNLRWEKTSSTNLGFEFSLLKRKLQVETSFYFKNTKDAYMNKTISSVNGLRSYVVNGGHIKNNGYSVDITYNAIMNRDLRWTISASFSQVFNEMKTTPDGESYTMTDFLNGTALVNGKAIGTFYSYKFLGLSPIDGGPLFDDYEDNKNQLRGLSQYDTYTKVLQATGSRTPDIAGNLSTSLRYKAFRLSANFAYSVGAKTRLFAMYGSAASNGVYSTNFRPDKNVSRDYLNRWQTPGDEKHTNIPAIISYNTDAYWKYTTHFSSLSYGDDIQTFADNYWDMYDYSNIRVVSANYLKCQSMNFTYEVPQSFLSQFGISRLAATVSAYNLFTICSKELKGQTPTQGGFSQIQLSDRPSFSFGLNVTF